MSERGATDQQLALRVQQGDEEAFNFLVLKYQHKVLGITRRYVRDAHQAQDVAQDAFIKAYLALPGFRGDSAFYTWLYRIVINTAKTHVIKQSRGGRVADVDVDDVESLGAETGRRLRDLDTPEADLARDELQEAVFSAIESLPEELKVVITLREMDGFSYQDISEIIECPIGTVRSRIFRARELIGEQIESVLEVDVAR